MTELGVYFFIGIISVLVILNILASYVVMKAYFFVKERRWYQLLVVWLLPLIGAFLMIYIHNEELFKRKRNTVGNHPNYTGMSGGSGV